MNSKLILGTVQMGLPYGINNSVGKISMEDSLTILDHAFDNGIEILDSAAAYGNAHQVIGTFHKKNTNKKFKVITKLPNKIGADIKAIVDTYLQEIHVSKLHGLLFHSYKSYKANIGTLHTLKDLKRNHKIDLLGVSVYTNDEIEEVILDETIDIIQLPFNLFDNINQRGAILEKARLKGKIIHTRSALLQGLFFKDTSSELEIVQNLSKELTLLREMALSNNFSISQMALGYCLQQKSIDNVLIGVDSIGQLKNNLESVNLELREELLTQINTIRIKNQNLLNPSLWK